MWVPESIDELHARLRDGTLQESTTFDGKRELGSNNASIAVDLCAMTVQGGVIVYGVDENDAGTALTQPAPIPLSGVRERVAQIAQTAIAEPPDLDLRLLEEPNSSGRGYLVALVPPSARAPHQIVLRGKYEGRFYGRGATGNRILGEADVAALFARRARLEQRPQLDLPAELRDWLGNRLDRGHRVAMLVKAVPVMGDDALLERVAGPPGASNVLNQIGYAMRAGHEKVGFGRVDPNLDQLSSWSRRDADHWASIYSPRGEVEIAMTLARDATATAVSARVGDTTRDRTVLFEDGVADLVAGVAAVHGDLLQRARYLGPVDLAVLVTPLKGVFSFRHAELLGGPPYPAAAYERRHRFAAGQLANDPVAIGRALIGDLTTAMVGDGFDPYAR